MAFLSFHCEIWEIRKVAVSNPVVSKSILKSVLRRITGKTPTDLSEAKILSMIWNKGVIFPGFHNKYLNLQLIYALYYFIGTIFPLYLLFCQLTRDEPQKHIKLSGLIFTEPAKDTLAKEDVAVFVTTVSTYWNIFTMNKPIFVLCSN